MLKNNILTQTVSLIGPVPFIGIFETVKILGLKRKEKEKKGNKSIVCFPKTIIIKKNSIVFLKSVIFGIFLKYFS